MAPGATLRIGCGAGYAGDRIDPARELAERGALDVLVFECLAERTIALAQLRRRHDPDAGYDPLLAERLRAVLPACGRSRTTIVTNMGAANPRAAGRVALQVARELGLGRFRVAVVLGDDVLDWIRDHDAALLDGGPAGATQASDLGERLVSANAYLGAEALLPALGANADLVLTGRVADPALFLAPLMHRFAWPTDDWTRLGRGICVGHLLECAAQVSGGYIADPGRFDVPDLASVGFPFAEVDAQGAAVIGKLPGTGGRIDRVTCSAQLLYEIEDPARYLQPDVVADFSAVTLLEQGPDRVAVGGARGHARPAQLKATLGWRDGFIGEGQISYAGPGARARGELALRVLRQRMVVAGLGDHELRAELIGVDAMHGAAGAAGAAVGRGAAPVTPQAEHENPTLSEAREVRVRLAVRCATRAEAERVGQEVEALYLNGPASGGGVTSSVREVIAAASCLVPREAAKTSIETLEL